MAYLHTFAIKINYIDVKVNVPYIDPMESFLNIFLHGKLAKSEHPQMRSVSCDACRHVAPQKQGTNKVT